MPTDLTPAVLQGHVLDVLRSLPESSVQCVVTSPPYWGLRAYGTEPQVWGGDSGHVHEWSPTAPRRSRSKEDATNDLERASVGGRSYEAQGGEACVCGAWLGELGLEPTPDLYVRHLVDVFDEVRRVLREDGTLWLNLGDTYSGGNNGYNPGAPSNQDGESLQSRGQGEGEADRNVTWATRKGCKSGLPIKNLVGIPWRVAFELQHRGWWLRAENIWAKPNPMPESVTDRPTRSHEQVFLLTKSARYFYDADAVRAALAPSTVERARSHYSNPLDNPDTESKHGPGSRRAYPVVTKAMRDAASGYAPSTLRELEQGYDGRATKDYAEANAQDPSATKASIIEGARARLEAGLNSGANLKSVWWIPTEPYPEAHFASFPQALAETCLRAGTSEKGACAACGAPWEREVEVSYELLRGESRKQDQPKEKARVESGLQPYGFTVAAVARRVPQTTGFSPTCSCPPSDPVPCLVLDPFCGSGTVLQVARSLGLRSIGIDLKPEYVDLAVRRSRADVPDLTRWHEPGEAA